jgi:hypothetical protein
MSKTSLGAAVIALTLAAAFPGDARTVKTVKTNSVDIEYAEPQSAEYRQVLQLVKEGRTLEKIQTLLSPIRLPRRLLIKTQGCDGMSNA